MSIADFRRLKKLLTLATSDNDNEALSSFRAATKLVAAAGYTWDYVIEEYRQNTRIVYQLIRSIDDFTGMAGEPFYIGEGFYDRVESHERDAIRKMESEQTLKDQVINRTIRLDYRIIKRILVNNLTKKEASSIEEALVDLVGRYPDGPLLNIARGGAGFQLDGLNLQARNLAVKKTHNTPEVKQHQSEAAKLAYSDPIKRNNHLQGVLEGIARRDKVTHSILTSIGTKKAMNDPIIRDRHRAAMALQETRDRLSEAQRRPDVQEKRRQRLERMWKSPEFQEFRDRHREATRAAMLRRARGEMP